MKKKELTELKTKTAVELDALLSKKQAELVKTIRETLEGKEKNLKKRKSLRREIVQILTIKGIITHK